MNLFFLRPVVKELRGIRSALERLADCWEEELKDKGLIVHPPLVKGESTIDYTDEEIDWAVENVKNAERYLSGASDKE